MTYEVERLPREPENLYRNVRCDGCDAPLKNGGMASRREDGAWEYLQPDGALEMHLVGGYGMAIDPFGEDPNDFIKLFCAQCLEKLCGQWPCIAVVVEANCSASIAHHCAKAQAFVWRPLSNCCNSFCENCGRPGSTYVNEPGAAEDTPFDRYARPFIHCMGPLAHPHFEGCDHIGPGRWAWELAT